MLMLDHVGIRDVRFCIDEETGKRAPLLLGNLHESRLKESPDILSEDGYNLYELDMIDLNKALAPPTLRH